MIHPQTGERTWIDEAADRFESDWKRARNAQVWQTGRARKSREVRESREKFGEVIDGGSSSTYSLPFDARPKFPIASKSPKERVIMSKHRECRVCVCAFGGVFLVLCLAGSPVAQAGSYKFVTLDAGGPYQTLLYGINDSGVVTGIAINPNNNYYGTGVIFNGGVPTLVSVPGAVDTEFYQNNTAGQIAVSYYGSDLIYHAAVYNSSTSSWNYLPDVPGYLENLAGGINNHGVVLGDPFLNSSYQGGVGWTWNGSSYSFFSAPGADPTKLGTATYSINDAGQIVGYYQDSAGVVHGYLKTGTNFTTLDAPGTVSYTSAQGINNQGYVTGYYVDASGTPNGYLWNNGRFTTIDVPFSGATGTDITSINDRGDLAGWYLDAAGNYHGFEALAVPEPGTGTLMATGLMGLMLFLRRRRRRADGIGAARLSSAHVS